MSECSIYLIRLSGTVEEDEINRSSPLRVTVVRTEMESTLLSVRTDQSGLIGLLRHLHGRGFGLLAVAYEP